MMNQRYQALEGRVLDLLRGYGQDLAVAKVSPNVQPWGTPELLVASVAIVAWLLQTSIKPIIEHLVKRKVLSEKPAASPEGVPKRVAELENIVNGLAERDQEMIKRLAEIREFLSVLLDERDGTPQSDDSLDALAEYLVKYGLSRRRAQRLAREILETAQILSSPHNE